MPGIGDSLREARMRQKIEVADVEAATKIRAKYLRALENEEFDLLHGSTFVRSFLRTYAQYLGLDAQRLIEEYRTQYEPREELEYHHPITPAAARRREPRYGGPPGPGALVAALVVAVLAFLLILGLTGEEDESGSDRGAQTAQTAPAQQEERRARRPRRRRAAPTVVRLRISPAEPTYACIDRGAGTDVVFEGTLDGPRTFRGRRLRLNLGKTSAAVRVNGRAVRIEDGPDPVGFEFTPRRRTALPEGQRPCA
jgi:hypothetical protein